MRRPPNLALLTAVVLGAAALTRLAFPLPQASATEVVGRDAIAEAQAKLAWRLIESEPSTGLDKIVSPASLASAFSVLGEGADQEMKAAMLKALALSNVDAAKGAATLAAARETLGKADPAIFSSADRLVFPPDEPPNPLAVAGLEKLGIEYGVIDLSKEAGAKEIDDWVKAKTAGVIPQILGKPLDKPSFVTLNALHFKAKWAEPFDPKATSQAPFQDVDHKNEPMMLMKLPEAQRSFRTDKDFVGVDLPFAGDRFSLIVVTSTDKPRSLKEFASAAGWLAGSGFGRSKGDLALPRFTIEGDANLLPALHADLAQGLKSPTALAGFVAHATIDAILQRAKIEVTEEGAETAAVTAIIVGRSLQVDDAIHMVVNKPFLFALRDRESGLILVAGYVGAAPKDKA